VDDSDLSAKEDDVTNELRKVDMKYVLTFSLIGLGIIFLAVKKLDTIHKKQRAISSKDGDHIEETDS
jgi:hypothetical protein